MQPPLRGELIDHTIDTADWNEEEAAEAIRRT
jgi:hypothetical protein